MQQPTVVIDTQIILRATLNERSLPGKLLFDLGYLYTLAISPAVRAEIADVLSRPKLRQKFPGLTDESTARVLAVLDAGLQITPEITPEITPAVSRDPKDDMFLALAVESKATYLVSEDNDLLVLDPYRGIRILTVLEFLQALNDKMKG